MVRHLPGLNALRTFESAARHLGFTKAASELGVTPAAVSNQVRVLEEQLGVRLFYRTSRAVRLTRAGEALLAGVTGALDLIGQTIERISAPDGQRILTVTATPSFAAKWLVPRLDRFRQQQPDADVRIDVSERLVDFSREDADIGIRFGNGIYPGLRVDCLFDELVFPVCSPKLLKRAHPLRHPSDLRHHTLIHVGWQAQRDSWPDWRLWLLAAGVDGIDPTRGIHFSQTALAIQAAIDGQGIALGNTSLVGDDLAARRLVRPFELSLKGPSSFAYYLVSPKATADQPLVKAFREWVLREISEAGKRRRH
ncbi:transcriptional regulator GcvA [Rhodospirillaceae bacterium SYSU D60014]|uniref:transcriptional regulator GcvA n=1 Tax=Virgifigura deserti TaxID=2268457 RepID=UPI000E66EF88